MGPRGTFDSRLDPETAGWHFVDGPLDVETYDHDRYCGKGDCIIAELDRLGSDLRCATGDAQIAASPCTLVDVFFVTGRQESDASVDGRTPTEWTLENLRNAKYEGVSPDHLYMRPANSSGPVSDYKATARTDIEKHGFTIIANIGDQGSDLAGGHAERTFKVPNPYFIP
jgi:hypothetical protein